MSHAFNSAEALVANPGRLSILTALVPARQEFVRLRGLTQLTDGNLATHARRLAAAGLVRIDKDRKDGRPVTTITLTSEGRAALESHVNRLVAALRSCGGEECAEQMPVEEDRVPANPAEAEEDAEDWID